MSIVGAIVLASATIVANPAPAVKCGEARGMVICEIPNPTPELKRLPRMPYVPTVQQHLKLS
jgi:hypothetical protein